jgi:hypothetical protein
MMAEAIAVVDASLISIVSILFEVGGARQECGDVRPTSAITDCSEEICLADRYVDGG